MARIVRDDPFSVFFRDPFFREPLKYFGVPLQYRDLDIEGVYSDGELKIDGKKVELKLDVQNFTPEQIKVKAVGNEIFVEGKKELKREDGWTRSHFERRYVLPEGFPPERVECHFDKGKLLIVAFRSEPLEEREVEIQDKSNQEKKE